MMRWDDTFDDILIAVIAQVFYVLAGFLLVLAIVAEISLLVPLPFAILGGIFHFIKVTTDGRVRDQNIPSHSDSERNG